MPRRDLRRERSRCCGRQDRARGSPARVRRRNGSRAWKQRGVEALAELVTWGLHDNPLTEDHDEKLEAYQLITGRLPQRHATEVDTGAYRSEDPLDAESGWDELR